MEVKSAFDNFELNISEEVKGLLKETSTWTYFLSIIGFIGIAFLLLFGALFGVIMGSMPVNPYEDMGFNMSYFGLIYVVLAIVYFFPVWYLFNFSRKIKIALKSKKNDELTSAFVNLKSHFKFISIFTIIVIVCMY